MVGAQRRLLRRQRTPVQLLFLVQLAPVLQQQREVADRLKRARMVEAQRRPGAASLPAGSNSRFCELL
jgi:hypothetical protein